MSSVPLVGISPPPAYASQPNMQVNHAQAIDPNAIAAMDPATRDLVLQLIKQNGQAPAASRSSGQYNAVPVQYVGSPVQQNLAVAQEGKQQERVKSPTEVEAENLSNQAIAINKEWYFVKYYTYENALNLYKKLPVDRVVGREMSFIYDNLIYYATWVRARRRKAVNDTAWQCALIPLVFCFNFPCVLINFFKTSKHQWVTTEKLTAYFNEATQFINDFISRIKTENNIQMSTDKNTVPDQVRKDLAFAYYRLGRIYSHQDAMIYSWGSNCCFGGEHGNERYDIYSGAQVVANYKLATEWNPNESDYSAAYQQADADLRRTHVHVTHVTYN